jgi:serine/threonine-protein kinase RsbW
VIKCEPNILIIKSEEKELQSVEEFLKDVFEFYNLPNTYYKTVLLCTTEATINSIVHGNKGDYSKNVELLIDCKAHLISVTITDEGEGFDTKALPDPTSKENLLKESGRGIHIIKTMAKSISFNDKGNSLQFQIECK